MYRLVMISIDLSETAHFAHWKSKTMSKTNFFLTVYFSDKKYFLWLFSWIEFCLGLNFVSDFVSDYKTAVLFRMQSFNFLILTQDNPQAEKSDLQNI